MGHGHSRWPHIRWLKVLLLCFKVRIHQLDEGKGASGCSAVMWTVFNVWVEKRSTVNVAQFKRPEKNQPGHLLSSASSGECCTLLWGSGEVFWTVRCSICMDGGDDDLIFILGWIYTWQLITSVRQRKLLSHHILSCTGTRQFPLEVHWVHCYDSIYLPPSVENVCCPCACFTHTSCWLPLSAEPLKNTGCAALRMCPGTRCSIVWPV